MQQTSDRQTDRQTDVIQHHRNTNPNRNLSPKVLIAKYATDPDCWRVGGTPT